MVQWKFPFSFNTGGGPSLPGVNLLLQSGLDAYLHIHVHSSLSRLLRTSSYESKPKGALV